MPSAGLLRLLSLLPSHGVMAQRLNHPSHMEHGVAAVSQTLNDIYPKWSATADLWLGALEFCTDI